MPNWFIGRSIIACAVTPCTLNYDGTITEGTGGTLLGRIDGVSQVSNADVEDISPLDSLNKNYVKTAQETTFTLSEIMQEGADGYVNFLNNLADGYDYVKVTLSRANRAYTFYGIITNYTENIRSKGKVVSELEVKQIILWNGLSVSTPPTYGANPDYAAN